MRVQNRAALSGLAHVDRLPALISIMVFYRIALRERKDTRKKNKKKQQRMDKKKNNKIKRS